MIRLWLENGKPAIFENWEKITVCADIIDGEYLENDRTVRADALLTIHEHRHGIGYVLLNLPHEPELRPAGTVEHPETYDLIDVFRVTHIDTLD